MWLAKKGKTQRVCSLQPISPSSNLWGIVLFSSYAEPSGQVQGTGPQTLPPVPCWPTHGLGDLRAVSLEQHVQSPTVPVSSGLGSLRHLEQVLGA